jgi:hypothetical protein
MTGLRNGERRTVARSGNGIAGATMRESIRTLLVAGGLAVAAAQAHAAHRFEANVTRFHSNPPAIGMTVWIEPPVAAAPTLEQANNLAALREALGNAGFVVVETRQAAALVASPVFVQRTREAPPKRSPISIGIGGGSFGRSGGVSIGTSFGVGGKKAGEVAVNSLQLQLRDAATGKPLWEGRAETEADSDSTQAPLSAAIPALARALLHDYPGAPGTTVRYKDPK